MNAAPDRIQPEADGLRQEWRCFHCGEVFTDPKAAANHFGVDHVGDETLCQMAQVDGGIARVIADLSEELQRYRSEDNASYREFYALGADHRVALIAEEQKGYERGLRDAKAMPAPKRHPVTYEDGTAPWSEDEQFDAQQSACDQRCQQYGSDHCEEKDGSCSECEYDAQTVLRAKYPPPASSVSLERSGGAT